MKNTLLVVLFLLPFLSGAQSTAPVTDTLFCIPDSVHISVTEVQDSLLVLEINEVSSVKKREHRRLVAAILCVTLGPFGAHRLYLGTKPAVAVAYTLTLGGGFGLLPVVDLFIICFTNDLSKYNNNPNVFMWNTETP